MQPGMNPAKIQKPGSCPAKCRLNQKALEDSCIESVLNKWLKPLVFAKIVTIAVLLVKG